VSSTVTVSAPATPRAHRRLDAALAALRSRDALVRNDGVDAAVGLGALAVPALLRLVGEPAAARAQVMYALAEIADARARPTFAAALDDADEFVRAHAASGLARLGDPQALAACLRTIDDGADPMHLDRTPAVDALGAMGLTAVPALLDLLMADGETTRLHAQRALEAVLQQRHGLAAGAGKPSRVAEAATRDEWRANGDYDYAGDAASRAAAQAAWRAWLKTARERA
jgi:HEAT repeat protein